MENIIRCSDQMEEFTAAEIKLSLMSIARYFPKINLLLMPILHAANELQKELGDIGLQNVKTPRSSIWQSQVCVNATTKQFHIEICGARSHTERHRADDDVDYGLSVFR